MRYNWRQRRGDRGKWWGVGVGVRERAFSRILAAQATRPAGCGGGGGGGGWCVCGGDGGGGVCAAVMVVVVCVRACVYV